MVTQIIDGAAADLILEVIGWKAECQLVKRRRRWPIIHGAARAEATPKEKVLYTAWRNMRKRCFNQRARAWRYYGGRGIIPCAAWSISFQAFWQDVEATWRPGLSLGRVDNGDGYHKDNVQWQNWTQQNNGRRPRANGKHAEEPF